MGLGWRGGTTSVNTFMTFHHEMSRNVLKPTFAVARNLLQGCESVDFEILVVTT